MANEIVLVIPSAPTNAKFIVLNSSGEFAYTTGTVFEAYNSAHVGDYGITLTRVGLTPIYLGTFPSWIGAGVYIALGFSTVTSTLQVSDMATGYAGSDDWFEWSGSARVPRSSRAAPTDIVTSGAITTSGGIAFADAVKLFGSSAAATAAGLFWDGSVLDSGIAQAGSSTTITLQAGANANDDYYKNAVVVITGGTGQRQNRRITGYVGATKVATISGDRNWVTSPDNTSTYFVMGNIP